MSEKFRKYFGKRFYQDKKGYWVNSMPIHAHRWVWINYHGTIPEEMDIHHKDGDKSNNEIDNLELTARSEHLKKHWEAGSFDLEQRRNQQTCLGCEKVFDTYQKWAKCCHANCYVKWRRKNKIGFIEKKCWICGSLYFSEKSSRVRTCGKVCGIKLQIINQK